MSDIFTIAGLVRVEFLEVAVNDLYNICTIGYGERKERVPEYHVVFHDLVSLHIVQNQLKCEKQDTKYDCLESCYLMTPIITITAIAKHTA